MKLLHYCICAILVLTLIPACTEDHEATGKKDCVFEQNDGDMDGRIDETELNIMSMCDEEAFTSISEIKQNLIGEWELVGHGEGWIHEISQPCGYITFKQDEFEFKFNDGHTDTLITNTWDIEEINWDENTYFRLKSQYYALEMTNFLQQIHVRECYPS